MCFYPPPTIHAKSSMPKARHADGGRLAPAMNLNSVKVYNLSSVGKALPAWLSAGKRKALVQKKEDNERRRSLSKLALVRAAVGHRAPLGPPPLAVGAVQTLRACAALRPAQRRQAYSTVSRCHFRRIPRLQARGDTGAVVSDVLWPRQVQRG